jgi:hypothetical protein
MVAMSRVHQEVEYDREYIAPVGGTRFFRNRFDSALFHASGLAESRPQRLLDTIGVHH